jgi:hypothetical protein
MDSKGIAKKENSFRDFRECSKFEDWLLFVFLLNMIVIWLFLTLYFVTGYITFDFK